MRTSTKVLITVLILLLATSTLLASGQVGIYAVIRKVVFEPNDKAPERIQIWGAFTLVDGGTGTGLVVAFGNLGDIGVFSDELISRPAGMPPYVLMIPGYGDLIQLHSKNPIRQESAAPTAPDSYPLNTGLTRLSNTGDLAAIVNQLQQVLKH